MTKISKIRKGFLIGNCKFRKATNVKDSRLCVDVIQLTLVTYQEVPLRHKTTTI
jgi:hypothetical protein